MPKIKTEEKALHGARQKRKLTRRDFLKFSGVTALGVAASSIPRDALAEAKKITGRKWGMVIDLRKCYGCHACSVACKSEFNVPLGVWRSWVKAVDKGKYPDVKRFFLPRLCNHCEKAPCVDVCPVKASYIDQDGTVLIKEERCIGCKMCITACPYNARFTNPIKKVADKCTFCLHRIEKGVVPSCVNTCPANARIFGDLNDPHSPVTKLVNTQQVQVLKPEQGTGPKVFYIGLDKDTVGRIG